MKAFITVPEAGNLYIDEVLVSIDYPRIFVCRNERREFFLFSQCEEVKDVDTWIVVKISPRRYGQILGNEIYSRDAYINAEEKKYFRISFNYETEETIFIEKNELDTADITPYNVYIGKKK